MLLGLVKEGSGMAANVLREMEVDLSLVRDGFEKLVERGQSDDRSGAMQHTPEAQKAIAYAMTEARDLNHKYVGTEHLLLGVMRERDGVAAQILGNLGVDIDKTRRTIVDMLSGASEPGPGVRVQKTQAVQFTSDGPWFAAQTLELTQDAGKLAGRLKHDTVLPDHVALVMLDGKGGSQLKAAIEATGADAAKVAEELTRRLQEQVSGD
ncbi:MAG: hypothetical protein CMJ49_13650 [Planctomycetaceae bacterium]|nr:hypothetical protein [Planctomycetaceae bacterium]